MGCFSLGLTFCIYLFSLSNILITIQYTTAQQYVYHFCLGDNYLPNGTFQSNLDRLLPSLSLGDTAIIDNAYYNTTAGRIPNTVYGSVQCRPDIVTFSICGSCVRMAIQDIKDRCPNSKQAIVWYSECILRYSDQYYFNIMQDSPGVYLWNNNNVSIPDQFITTLGDLLNDLVGKTASGFIPNFATGEKTVTNHTKVYGFVQCTADIPSSNCIRCLRGAISELPNCCMGKSGGRVIRPSCNFRYEMYPFLRYTNTLSPPLLSSPARLLSPPPLASLPPLVGPPSSTNTTTTLNSAKNKSSVLAISIAIPSVIAVLCGLAFYFFRVREKKTKTKKLDYLNDKIQNTESMQFNFSTVIAATDNFSEANKLGEGGFGSVYK
ncbi:hypothetical protein MKW92_048515, partial [Papaver armeniacum]